MDYHSSDIITLQNHGLHMCLSPNKSPLRFIHCFSYHLTQCLASACRVLAVSSLISWLSDRRSSLKSAGGYREV